MSLGCDGAALAVAKGLCVTIACGVCPPQLGDELVKMDARTECILKSLVVQQWQALQEHRSS